MIDKNDSIYLGLVGPYPPPFGGMANQAKQLSELLEKTQVDVFFVQTNAPYRPSFIENVKGLRAVFRLIPFLWKVWKLAGKVEIIHVFSNSGWAWQLFSAPVIWAGWLRKKPVIVNYRGGEARQYFTQSIRWIKPTLSKTTKIIVPSDYLKEIFSEFGFASEVIPNIINLEKFPPKTNHSLNYHLIVARNLEAIYGINIVIQAVAIVKKTFPQIRLSVAGGGPQKNELEALVKKLHLENQVFFTGKIPPEKMRELFQEADIMLNASTVDNMPNAILEAMACSVPIVTSNAGGIPYITSHNITALIVNINDPEGMAKEVIKLYQDNELYTNLSKNGVLEAQKYAWPVIKEQWLHQYRELINNT